jgi:hypothetical protein
MLTVEVRSAGVERVLERAQAACLRTRPLMARLGKGLEKQLRGHFLARDREGNSRGWASKHFWNREVRANTALAEFDETQATVRIASPAFAQKLYGGTITPKRGRALAIPLTAEAYAAGSPKNWSAPGGRYLFRPAGRQFLAVRERGKGKGALRAMWALVPSVTQAPDARALPPRAALEEQVARDAEAWVGAQLRSGQT